MADEVQGGEEGGEAGGAGGDVPAGRHFLLVLAAGVVSLAAVIGFTIVAVPTTHSPPRDRVAEAGATATTWLRAWERDDRTALRALARTPNDELNSGLDALASLHPTSIR